MKQNSLKSGGLILLLILWTGLTLKGQQAENPYQADIRHFRETDSITPPPDHAILFIGSSTFTLWHDLSNYFPGYTILNRAFGGSRLTDQIEFFDQVVAPYHPKLVVIYCGENDFAASDTLSAPVVLQRFTTLFRMIREKAPNVKITYISMKPSPSRWHLASKFMEANSSIREFLYTQPNTSYLSIWEKILDESSVPDAKLFLDDQLHLNAVGYKILQQALLPHLLK